MTTFDDPIFDPWGASGDGARPVRWRSNASSPGVPATRPLRARSRIASLPTDPVPAPTSELEPGPRPNREAGSTIRRGMLLSELITPRLRAFATKLESARHHTVIDERVGQDPPTVRLRIRRWTGPFDPVDESGSVIEFVEFDGAEHIVARLWLDPLRPKASHECDFAPADLDAIRIDGLLFDFLAKVLKR
jgi:hypothetical protein